tara:strand:+ start:1234 stop:1455 length:222 start_codon:yes stop_codon:yes gene_type:complete
LKLLLLNGKKIKNNMDKKDRNKWTNKFREMGKKKGSRQDFIKLYKEMKKEKDNNKNNSNSKSENEKSWKDLIE